MSGLPAGAAAEQAFQPGWLPAGELDSGIHHTCAIVTGGKVRCWGFSGDGQLGYANTNSVGDDETPGSVGTVDLGAGHTATAISAGDYHTCALLDDGSVECWGFGGDGRLGYANVKTVGDDETPGKVGAVFLGAGHTAKAISAGGDHTCAVLDDGHVLCWGYGYAGQLGYGNRDTIGATQTPGSLLRPVELGAHTAKAITAGRSHTCAVLEDDSVRCWGANSFGQLGYGNTTNVGDARTNTPDSAGAVNLGGHKAAAISAGGDHTCALLDDGTVRCWGLGSSGQLGYGNSTNVGDTPTSTPDLAGPVNVGGKAIAISAGGVHTCARLDDGTARCWGNGGNGRLGYADTANIGDDETPSSVGPINLGRGVLAIGAGQNHSCARLDDASVRCWGSGATGRLGYCNQNNIGDDEAPGSVGPVDLGAGGAQCIHAPASAGSSAGVMSAVTKPPPVSSDAVRARGLRGCLATVAARAEREVARSRRRRAAARRHATTGRARCLGRYARIPGHVTGLHGRAMGKTHIELSFNAPGTDANHPPPARSYLVKQSLRPMHNTRDFAHAQTLCKGACRFSPANVGGKITLTVTDLHPHTTYYYAIAARDNVSSRRGPHTKATHIKTR